MASSSSLTQHSGPLNPFAHLCPSEHSASSQLPPIFNNSFEPDGPVQTDPSATAQFDSHSDLVLNRFPFPPSPEYLKAKHVFHFELY
jgi:hypothetical protein